MNAPSPWWSPSRHADRRQRLLARGRIKSAIRAWFEAQGFTEVETGCLQVSPGNETHLHAFRTELIGTELTRRDLYLHTSPEFAMKKLLAAGEEKIFTFAPVFRNRERGRLHAPEFTMLEWYRAGALYEQLWHDCECIVNIAAEQSGRDDWSFRNRHCNVTLPPYAISVDHAFKQFAHVDLRSTYDAISHNRDAVADAVLARDLQVAINDTWSDIFSKTIAMAIEPVLGTPQPTILHSYPVHEAAMARPNPNDTATAERFEMYVCGVELANGFGELNDPQEQRRRFTKWMDDKQRIYGERYPIDEDFLAALAQMPPAAGCALGFDRLAMLATGAERVDDVIWTPLADAGK